MAYIVIPFVLRRAMAFTPQKTMLLVFLHFQTHVCSRMGILINGGGGSNQKGSSDFNRKQMSRRLELGALGCAHVHPSPRATGRCLVLKATFTPIVDHGCNDVSRSWGQCRSALHGCALGHSTLAPSPDKDRVQPSQLWV